MQKGSQRIVIEREKASSYNFAFSPLAGNDFALKCVCTFKRVEVIFCRQGRSPAVAYQYLPPQPLFLPHRQENICCDAFFHEDSSSSRQTHNSRC